MKALIIVDMVKGFIEPETKDGKCALYLPEAKNIIPEVNKHIKESDIIIWASDCHDNDDEEFKLYPKHCVGCSDETLVAEGLDLKDKKISLILKTRFSAFYKTHLEEILREKSIKEITLVGVCTDICILFTAADAVMRNIKVNVPEKAVFGLTKEGHEWALKYMKTILGVNII